MQFGPVRAGGAAEGAVDRVAQLVGEQDVRQPGVHEVRLAQREPYPVQRVVGEAPGLGQGCSGGCQGVPRTRRGVSFPVLHGVQEVGEPAEEPAGLGERLGVAGPPGEYRGVRERRGGGGLGRLGDRQDRGAGSGERLEAHLPVHGVDEHGGVEADAGAATGAGPAPARGDPARRERHRPAGQQPVTVGHVVAHLGGGEHQRDGGGEARALALRDGGGPHATQRAGTGGPASARRPLCLSLRQNRYQQTVIIRDQSGELPVVFAQCEAQPAQMRHPLGLESLTEPMTAGPDHPEHDTPRASYVVELRHRIDRAVHPYAPPITRTPGEIIFHSQSAAA